MKTAITTPRTGWFPLDLAAAALGITKPSFNTTHQSRLPAEALRRDGRRVFVYMPTVLALYIEREIARAAPKPPADIDPLLAGDANSPALEEYRRHRARIAKVEADEREGLVGRYDLMRPALASAMSIIRHAGDRLEREYGHDAATMLTEAVDEAIAGIDDVMDEAEKKGISHDAHE